MSLISEKQEKQETSHVGLEVEPPPSDNEIDAIELRGISSDSSSLATLLDPNTEKKLNDVDLEKLGFESGNDQSTLRTSRTRLTTWMIVNALATISIVRLCLPRFRNTQDRHLTDLSVPITQVFTNKAIFDDPSFRHCQVGFAAFHLFVTAFTLYILSRPFFGMFVPQRVRVRFMLPLAVAMCLNVVLQNLSLTYSSITFFQIARILLTPTVAVINFFFYRKSIPQLAALTLLPMCLGVGLISYYEPKSSAGSTAESVGFLSVGLALASVLVGSVYTVWIASYQKKFEINAFQLLFNQAPMGGVLLLFIIPWTDTLPSLDGVASSRVMMILLVRKVHAVHQELVTNTCYRAES